MAMNHRFTAKCNRKFYLAAVALFSFGFANVSGCQQSLTPDYHKLDLGTVTGTIKLEGQPLVNHHVIFQSEKGTFSFGKTDRNGKYSLMFNSEKAGVTKGEKVVRIRKKSFSESELFPSVEEDDVEEGVQPVKGDLDSVQGGGEDTNSDDLPAVYHVDSHIKVTVTDDNQVINFDLKSDGSTTGPN